MNPVSLRLIICLTFLMAVFPLIRAGDVRADDRLPYQKIMDNLNPEHPRTRAIASKSSFPPMFDTCAVARWDWGV